MITTQMYPISRPVRILSQEGRDKIVRQMHGAAALIKLLRREGMEDCFSLQEQLAQYTSFRIGGIAQVMLMPHSEYDLRKIVNMCRSTHVEPYLLGGGSNLLITQAVIPTVLMLRRLKDMQLENNRIYASAGVSLTQLIKTAMQHGLAGLESMAGVPGTIGGALAGNSGSSWEGRPVEVGNFVQSVTVLEKSGVCRTLDRSEIEFGYRHSSLANYIIVGAWFEFGQAPEETLRERYNISLRKKLETQPISDRSAGCIFKNPAGMSAWKLIRDAGLIGMKVGAAMVSPKHANFIVNLGHAQGNDVLDLIQIIRAQVKDRLGVDLSLEVKIW